MIATSHESDFFSEQKKHFFFELPSNISTMVHESLVCYNSDKIGSIYENLDRIKSIVRSYDIYLWKICLFFFK